MTTSLTSYLHALHSNTIKCLKESRNSKVELVFFVGLFCFSRGSTLIIAFAAYLTPVALCPHSSSKYGRSAKHIMTRTLTVLVSDPSISVLQQSKVRGAYVLSEVAPDSMCDGGRVQNIELVMHSSPVWSSLRGTHLNSVCHCPGCPLTLSAVL